MANGPSLHRIRFFEKIVHLPAWRDSLAGKNEEPVIKIIESVGYTLGKDFVRQYPIGERFVMDFAFINEQVSIEVDGENHKYRKQRKLDEMRDKFLHENNWVSIRVPDAKINTIYGRSFFKSLIMEIVEERRAQWEIGQLVALDVPYFKDEDFE